MNPASIQPHSLTHLWHSPCSPSTVLEHSSVTGSPELASLLCRDSNWSVGLLKSFWKDQCTGFVSRTGGEAGPCPGKWEVAIICLLSSMKAEIGFVLFLAIYILGRAWRVGSKAHTTEWMNEWMNVYAGNVWLQIDSFSVAGFQHEITQHTNIT